jgi:hypothetical protein
VGGDAAIGTNFTTKGTGAHVFSTNSFGSVGLVVTHTASAVNYPQITGATTGNGPVLFVQGSDSNIELNLQSKGTSGINLRTGVSTATQFRVGDAAGAVNYIQVIGSTTGTPPIISSQGSDGSLGMKVQWKGAGNFFLQSGSGSYNQLKINGANAAVNNLVITGTTAGNAPSLSVEGSDTNIDINLTPKGTGNVTTASPLTVTNTNVSTSTTTGALVVTGGVGITGNIYVAGNIVQTGTGYHTIPVGTTAQRPVTAASGMIRYNTSLSSFEGYGAAWASLGGVKSVDGNTYILAEASVGAGDNILWFYNNATNTAKLSTSNLTLSQTTTSTSPTTGALQVAGGVGIAGNLYVGSNLIVPVGTTDQRGSVQGAIRYNTTTSAFESYDGATWNKLAYGTGGDFPTGDFGDLTTLTDAFGVATSTTYDCNAAGTVITSDLEAAGTASLAPI